MFEKLKVEKVELVKRVIRQNNYDQYEKTYRQCTELGLNINRQALDRFANKLELIDKAQLSKRQYELHKMELAAQEEKQNRPQQQVSRNSHPQLMEQQRMTKDMELEAHLDSMASAVPRERRSNPPPPPPPMTETHRQVTRSRSKPSVHGEMTYDQVKQRETAITFELGELKIRENELLQELIRLTEMLDNNQKN